WTRTAAREEVTMSEPASAARPLIMATIAVLLLIAITVCSQGNRATPIADRPMPTTAPTVLDCREPVPVPAERRNDCVRAALFELQAADEDDDRSGPGKAPRCCGVRYVEEDHALLVTIYSSKADVDEAEKHRIQDIAQRAVGLRTFVEIS